jgi:hypothetical protein
MVSDLGLPLAGSVSTQTRRRCGVILVGILPVMVNNGVNPLLSYPDKSLLFGDKLGGAR